MKPPEFNINPKSFWTDPYPDLARMRQLAPVCFVPELGAVLFTKRDDVFICEKNVEVFSSDQPDGLMNVLMGQNMMRKDGQPHLDERKQAFPTLSPRTVRDVWTEQFVRDTEECLSSLEACGPCDFINEFAMPLSAHALRHITGLVNLTPQQMDGVSQGMIDGIANYSGDPAIEARCRESTALIDKSIDDMLPVLAKKPDMSLLSVLVQAGQALESVRANVKLAISGGQNEPRDAIAGTVWALLSHPMQLNLIQKGDATWLQAFEEYARWVSPIGMSPRRIAKPFTWNGIDLEPGSRVFFMFSSGNRDEAIFDEPERFDIMRANAKTSQLWRRPAFLRRRCCFKGVDCKCCAYRGSLSGFPN